jgi:hypothetical protein
VEEVVVTPVDDAPTSPQTEVSPPTVGESSAPTAEQDPQKLAEQVRKDAEKAAEQADKDAKAAERAQKDAEKAADAGE